MNKDETKKLVSNFIEGDDKLLIVLEAQFQSNKELVIEAFKDLGVDYESITATNESSFNELLTLVLAHARASDFRNKVIILEDTDELVNSSIAENSGLSRLTEDSIQAAKDGDYRLVIFHGFAE